MNGCLRGSGRGGGARMIAARWPSSIGSRLRCGSAPVGRGAHLIATCVRTTSGLSISEGAEANHDEVEAVTAQRVLCPTSATWHGRHMVTDRRWSLTTPDGATVTLCSAACTVSWLCHALPIDRPTNVSARCENVSNGGQTVSGCVTRARAADCKADHQRDPGLRNGEASDSDLGADHRHRAEA